MRKTLADLRHVFSLLKKTYMLLGFVERILRLIIGPGGQYPKGNPWITGNRVNGASSLMD
jgi:hypothetical protein